MTRIRKYLRSSALARLATQREKTMKYRAVIEIEFETEGDPLDVLHRVMKKTTRLIQVTKNTYSVHAEHYHILEQPSELK